MTGGDGCCKLDAALNLAALLVLVATTVALAPARKATDRPRAQDKAASKAPAEDKTSEKARAEEHEETAENLFRAGNYLAALAEFQLAHKLWPKSDYIFNMAQC